MTTQAFRPELSTQELTGIIVSQMYKTYFMYGPGLFEKIYEAALAGRLRSLGLHVARQQQVFITDHYVQKEPAFYTDLIVEGRVIIELKSVAKLPSIAFIQLRSYLRLTGIRTGILVNFNCEYLKQNIHRVNNDYETEVQVTYAEMDWIARQEKLLLSSHSSYSSERE